LQRARRLDRATLERLLGADADFVSLQFKAEDEAPLLAAHNVQHFGGDTRDFAELAALIETVDLVISIDTNVAHIAGALGKPLWILLPFTPDWRWLNDRPDTPWYPQARLFRQQSWGDWRSVADDVLAALQ
jgi:ADP-heptose:LPS heptosyltransferase